MSRAVVVIPNMNGMQYLPRCLKSLQQQSETDFETVLVDNGSSDGSPAYVQRHYPWVKIRRSPVNTGFCRAVNEGIRASHAPYVILLNNDTVCDPGFVRELLAAMERHPDAASCQARMLRMDEPEVLDDAGDFCCLLGWAFARGKGQAAGRYDKEDEIFFSCGGAAIYRRTVLDALGKAPFEPDLFAYLEDLDVGWRARRMGLRHYYVPSAQVLHAGSASSGSRYNEFKVYHTARNQVCVMLWNLPAAYLAADGPALAAGAAIKQLFFLRRGLGGAYARGVRDGFAMALRHRRFRHKERSARDGSIQRMLLKGLWLRLQSGAQ